MRGRHPFRITTDGLVLYPRIEAVFAAPSSPDRATTNRLSTGTEGLDPLIGGGLVEATITALLGPTGIGKTTIGLHFLGRSSADEPGLLFSFYETPARIRLKATAFGIDVEGLERRGALEILWQAQTEHVMDELAHRLRDAIRRRGVKRLFVDGLNGFMASTAHPDRIARFFAALSNEIRALGVTTLCSLETRDIIGPTLQVPIDGVSAMVENMIVLRYVETRARTRRLLSITKIRDSGFDPALQEFEITDQGISFLGPFPGYEGVLSGYAHMPGGPSPAGTASPKRPPDQE